MNYWIESWDYARKSAKIWVKVPKIQANEGARLIMYYGNPSAISASSGIKTFDFFDDFEGTSLDATKWTVETGSSYSVSGGKLAVGSRTIVRSYRSFSAPAIFRMRVSLPSNPTIYWTAIGAKVMGNVDAEQLRFVTFSNSWRTDTRVPPNEINTAISVATLETAYEMRWKFGEVVFERDSSIVATHKTNIPSNPLYVNFINHPYGNSRESIMVDWSLVRKYSSPEPTVILTPPKSSSLFVIKSASPYSIRQFQETSIKVSIENSGTTDIKAIEVMDSIHPSFDLISGDFPNPKKFDIIRAGESREIQYTIKAKESGTFTLDPATVTYADKDGNIQEVKSEPVSINVVASSEGAIESSSPSELSSSSAVLLHGEKTDVVLGEDVLLKLSAANLITKPPMTVQVILYPPSGMSVTGSEFVKSGAGIYTTTYTLNPGDGKDIEIYIKSNQIGDFGVKGRIVYYFGDDKKSAEDHTLTLPIKVRKEPGQTMTSPTGQDGTIPKASGFAGELTIIGILFAMLYIIKRGQ